MNGSVNVSGRSIAANVKGLCARCEHILLKTSIELKMTRDELFAVIDKTVLSTKKKQELKNAVDALVSASNGAKPIVSGALPLTDAEKLAVAWKALEWVGFRKGEEFEDEDVLKMLSGNDR